MADARAREAEAAASSREGRGRPEEGRGILTDWFRIWTLFPEGLGRSAELLRRTETERLLLREDEREPWKQSGTGH